MMLTGASCVYAVFGDPVAHSLSPILHNGWFADHAMDAVYVGLRLQGEAARLLGDLGGWGFMGANVTVPHKSAALKAAARSEESAKRIGAANTLRIGADGALEAFNTDAPGFLDSLRAHRPSWSAKGKSIALIGAGGAARAIVDVLAQHEAGEIRIANRTPAHAEDLAPLAGQARFGVFGLDRMTEAVAGADLIVQAGSGGLAGGHAVTPDFRTAAPDAIAVDIVYKPLCTPFLAAAAAAGLETVDGLGMLIHQAARAFEIWRGVMPDTQKGRARLLAHLGQEP